MKRKSAASSDCSQTIRWSVEGRQSASQEQSWLYRFAVPSEVRFAPRRLTSSVKGKGVFAHGLTVDEMLLDDFFQHLRSTGMIPNPVGIHDGDGSLRANAEAIDLAPVNERLWAGKIQLLEPRLQKLPR